MLYTFKLENLDCANCAAKIEAAVAKAEGVTACSVNFLSQKMTVETANEMSDETSKKIVKLARRADPDVSVKRV